MKISAWNNIQTEFDTLVKMMGKASSLLAANNGHPKFYIKLLCDLDDQVTSSLKDKVAFKKLSAANGRSLNRMKLAFRKYIKDFAEQMKEWRANPVDDEEQVRVLEGRREGNTTTGVASDLH